MKRTFLFTILLTSFSLLLSPAQEPSWTILHGPNRDNVSPDTGLLKAWKEDGPPLLWKNSTVGNTDNPGYSSVTVAEGRVFTAGNATTPAPPKEGNNNSPPVEGGHSAQQNVGVVARVYALDEKTGKELWHYDNGSGWTLGGHFPGERSTPTIDGNRVYAYSAMGRLACLEAATGKEIWAKNLKDE
jgi:outer membrane protein assembly factor BamB